MPPNLLTMLTLVGSDQPPITVLITCQDVSMEVDTDAENALKAPPISADTVSVIVYDVEYVWDTPMVVEYSAFWSVVPRFVFEYTWL